MNRPTLTLVNRRRLTIADQRNAEEGIADLIRRSEERAQELRDAELPSEEGYHSLAAGLALMDVAQNWSKRWRRGKAQVSVPTFNDFEENL